MKDTQEIMSTQEMPSTVTFWIEITTHHHHLLLVSGHSQEGEAMRKNIQLIGNLDDMINSILTPIMRWILFMTLRLIHFRNLINFGMAIAMLRTIVIMDLISLLDLGDVSVMIMHMMIMSIDPVLPLKTGRIVVKGIMTGIVMILIMREVVGEMVIGGGVNPVIENVINLVEKEIRAHIEDMNNLDLDLVDARITLGQGPLEFESMVEVIERTALMTVDMKGEGTVKRNASVSIILWYVLLSLFYLLIASLDLFYPRELH